jgi:hypothetical protein
MLHNKSYPVGDRRLSYHSEIVESVTRKLPYPPDTKAFLYYSTPPEGLRIAGSIRLRVTPSEDPTSFDSGSDLMTPNGQPWSRPLCVLPKMYRSLYKKLREERLVSDDLDAVLPTITVTLSRRVFRFGYYRLLYTLNDTFIVDFSCREKVFYVITEQCKETLPFTGPYHDNRGGGKGTMPYTGAYTNHFLSILLG